VTALSEMGAIIAPPVPVPCKPETLEDMSITRWPRLDLFDIDVVWRIAGASRRIRGAVRQQSERLMGKRQRITMKTRGCPDAASPMRSRSEKLAAGLAGPAGSP